MRATEPAACIDQEYARAKVNLTLHVTGRRSDGYHLLDSVAVFPEVGDRLRVVSADKLGLEVSGPFARGLDAEADNLVLRAACLLDPAGAGALHLEKHLPVAAGIGGGSADAAAALRLLSRHWGMAIPPAERLASLGADVPVCLSQTPQRMGGIGDKLTSIPSLPHGWIVLANPGVPMPTGAVFAALETRENPPGQKTPGRFANFRDFIAWLALDRNDLEEPARRICPEVEACLYALKALPGAALTRMSGSGATCFALFEREGEAARAADRLKAAEPSWWVAAAAF